MRELVYYVAVSLDGYIAGPEGQFDAFSLEGDHMADLERLADALPTDAAAHLGITQPGTRFGAVLMGWNTYAAGLPDGITSPYRHLEQFVFSRSRHSGTDDDGPENLVVTDRDPVDVVRELKREPGADIWLCGGGNLAAQLVDEIDRLIVKRHPKLFGSGIPAFASSAYRPSSFEMVDNRTFETGVAVTEYARRR
ncbi:dihydrofolate reductase [Rhodococcus triatomae]|uniref:Dihydrofolate reductase n=1 Tax=Rhodococcus triatomae TaxID=300028 RepID=A0A1G8RMI8_9NOCA|nr:dihydrofolate reductase family protein [Rhodococcus triatomae]QNG19917.1 dihydrofolate reductase [Rhodococcus triatomae]QNG24168.1 dihydrofolate reductase [Rhodococcus triatomae]SDJ17600.1 Dihydrofolate reductase [Rhodococcus triatomae]